MEIFIKLHIDLETYSDVDLRAQGMYVYAEHPTTEILMVGAAYDDKEPVLFDTTTDKPPQWLLDDLIDPTVDKLAFNAPFEMEILRNVWGLDIQTDEWTDVMVLAKTLSFSGGLGMVGECVGIPQDARKLSQGRALIKKFCGPKVKTEKHPHGRSTKLTDPEAWADFCGYCVQDVIAERAIYRKMQPFVKYTHPDGERYIWLLDQEINKRGLPIDSELVASAIEVYGKNLKGLLAAIKSITGLDNPNSVVQLRSWLATQGVAVDSLTKEVLRDVLLRPDLSSHVRQVLLLRQEASKVSPKKFSAFKKRTSVDSRLRGGFQFYGAARTGRWTGNGVQPHNLVGPTAAFAAPDTPQLQRKLAQAIKAVKQQDCELLTILYPSVTDALVSTIRCAIAAPEGQRLRVADLSSIETVVIGWLSGCDRILDLFRTGKDAYKDFATEVFSVEYDDVTKDMRKFCKPPVLGCGFALGANGLAAYAQGFGMNLSQLFEDGDKWLIDGLKNPEDQTADTLSEQEKAEGVGRRLVNVYRRSYPQVSAFWASLKFASFDALTNASGFSRAGKITYEYIEPFLFCHLPSGRSLSYFKPEARMQEHPKFERPVKTLTYEGIDQYTRKWCRLTTHPGKLAENAVQAVARDLLAAGLQNADAAGFDIVGHVHDEILATTAEGGPDVEGLINCMTDAPAWAEDMPIFATGWEGSFYLKD